MATPEHLFIGDDGNLYDTRQENWSETPIRRNYSRQHVRISSIADFKAALRAGPYAWPGGYPVAFIAINGDLVCHDCARENVFQVMWSIRDDIRDGWQFCGQTVIEETYDDACSHCSKPFNR